MSCLRSTTISRGALAAGCALSLGLAGPQALAAGGAWIPGSSFDPATQVASYFARYVAAPGEGQMTVRCDTGAGLTIDAAVTGNGETPEGITIGEAAEVSIHLVGSANGDTPIKAEGQVRLRSDGAVLLVIAGEEAGELGNALLVPAEKADVTIGNATGTVPLAGASDAVGNVAKACSAWPR